MKNIKMLSIEVMILVYNLLLLDLLNLRSKLRKNRLFKLIKEKYYRVRNRSNSKKIRVKIQIKLLPMNNVNKV